MRNNLFEEFSEISKEQWQQQVLKDLKGVEINTLNWHTEEGFVVAPYYNAEDLNDLRLLQLYASQVREQGFLNQPAVLYTNEADANKKIINHLSNGANAVLIDFVGNDIAKIDMSKLLHHIKLSETPVFFKVEEDDSKLIQILNIVAPYQKKGGLYTNRLSTWAQIGKIQENYFQTVADNLRNTQNSPAFKIICIDGSVFHRAGASAAQELAAMLAVGVTYLDKLTDLGISASDIFAKMYFSVAVGTNYFMEIAKLRALRYLWQSVQEQTFEQVQNSSSAIVPAYIQAQTSTFYDAALTPNNNMLRATTQAMSAIIGGADALTVHPYDAAFATPDEFSERIARNVGIILKEESYLDKVNDPAAGSYFIDSLTLQLADTAWDLFVAIENKGGFMEAIKQNFLQDKIEETYQTRLAQLQNQTKIMVGVNKFKSDDNVAIAPSIKESKSEIGFKLLKNRRIAEEFGG